MSSNISIRVEVYAGSLTKTTINDMCALAARVGVNVCSEMNGVGITVSPGADPAVAHERFEKEMLKPDPILKYVHVGAAQ